MRNIIKNTAVVLLMCISSLIGSEAQALVAESSSQAMSRGMFEPGFVPGAQTAKQNKVERKTYNYGYDYSKDIANKLLNTGSEGTMVLVDLVDAYKTSLAVSKGQFVAVRLTEEDDTKWNFENRSGGLQFLKREKRGDVVIMLYKAVGTGGSRINFDLMTTGNPVEALEAKVLEVRVI